MGLRHECWQSLYCGFLGVFVCLGFGCFIYFCLLVVVVVVFLFFFGGGSFGPITPVFERSSV